MFKYTDQLIFYIQRLHDGIFTKHGWHDTHHQTASRHSTTMATAASSTNGTMAEEAGPYWHEQQKSQDPNARSVTPAMNNTRGVVRNGTTAALPYSAPSPALGSANAVPNAARATTPQQRYYGAYNTPAEEEVPQPPPSTGLIRLTLRKPMGIVFEPMYDPNNPTIQRGVRICDLPRTGAAALSRKLEIGDELLSINDKTMSRLTFDEIMDFIIEADPDQVNLLFRRPRKGVLPGTRPTPKTTPQNASVKWPDDDQRKIKKEKKKGKEKEKEEKREKKASKRSKRDEDSTVISQEESLEPIPRRKYRSSGDMYENESFLDMLIDTICGKPDGYCGDRPRRGDEDYYSDEEDTFASMDDSTYVTYESEPPVKHGRRTKNRRREDDSTMAEETEDDTYASLPEVEDRKRHKKKNDRERTSKSPAKESRHQEKAVSPKRASRYEEEEETLQDTVEETVEPSPAAAVAPAAVPTSPLGLDPKAVDQVPAKELNKHVPAVSEPEDEPNPAAPIPEVEYDDAVDHGADVSVMESLGGPSLLIEKQRQAAKAAARSDGPVPAEIVNNFGRDFPSDFGLSREQTIQKNPMKFYTHVVKALLEENEPEKVRLLDKLLAKYEGREDHLVQKLAVRYTKTEDNATPTIPEESEGNGFSFSEKVNQNKESEATAGVVKTAKERMATASPNFETVKWPNNKEVKVETEALDEEGEEVSMGSESVSGSEFSNSIDGTSPAVIAQVSELLNYVYGKTSVPGQIDRVSTIMRAYEGREAVLLELLETKALIKANGEKENAGDLPSFLRNSPALQHAVGDVGQEGPSVDEGKVISPLSGPSNGGIVINDDVSSMSGVSSPADDADGNKAVSTRSFF